MYTFPKILAENYAFSPPFLLNDIIFSLELKENLKKKQNDENNT